MDITEILIAASSPDPTTRQPAELQLRGLEQRWQEYLQALVTVLADPEKPGTPRQLAGLLLKNALVSRDPNIQRQKVQKWCLLDQNVRTTIQSMVMKTLEDGIRDIRNTAALVVGKIASAELPKGGWPNVVESLVGNIMTQSNAVEVKEASFQALGYVCEECPKFLQDKSNLILSAIAQGMFKDNPHVNIKLAATQALVNSLEFTRSNFQKERDRGQIMTMVFQAATSESPRVREAAFNCLVEIGALFYDFMPAYIQDIFMMTGKAIQDWLQLTDSAAQEENEPVALQAIEFWSAICEAETKRSDEIEEAKARGISTNVQFHNFATQALPQLMPLILTCLTKQTEEIDDETWNVSMAAGIALGNFALSTKNAVVSAVLPFVEKNIQHQNWRFREAATLAFGAILEGPSKESIEPLVSSAVGFILGFLQDPAPQVRDTAAWTIGRICDIAPDTFDENVLPNLMQALHNALDEEPRIASHVCWAIYNLAEAVDLGPEAQTSPLSDYFQVIVAKLLTVSQRTDAGNTKLIPSAYEAINLMVQNAALDVHKLIEQLIPDLAERLKNTIMMGDLTGAAKEKQNQIQALLCASLQSIIMKLNADVLERYSDALMQLFLQVLNSKNGTVHEEALMAVAAVASQLGEGFEKYMPAFVPFLKVGLQNVEEFQVCIVAVGVVSDLCRALKTKIGPVCDDIMQHLLQNLQNFQVERRVKPHIIACISDVALAIGGFFDRYLPYVMMLLVSASQTQFDEKDRNIGNLDYLNSLRFSILETYTGIIQGLQSGNKAQLFEQFLPSTMGFLELISKDQTVDDEVLMGAVGVIGDLAAAMNGSPQVKQYFNVPCIQLLLQRGAQSQHQEIRKRAEWSQQFVLQYQQ